MTKPVVVDLRTKEPALPDPSNTMESLLRRNLERITNEEFAVAHTNEALLIYGYIDSNNNYQVNFDASSMSYKDMLWVLERVKQKLFEETNS